MYEIRATSPHIALRLLIGALLMACAVACMLLGDHKIFAGVIILALSAIISYTVIKALLHPTPIARADTDGIDFRYIGHYEWDKIAYGTIRKHGRSVSAIFTFNDGRQYSIPLSALDIPVSQFRKEINTLAGRVIFD